MTDEERRLLRLENADATLVELVAKQQERTFKLEELAAKQQESTARLEQLAAKQQERTVGLEEAFKMLVELVRSASEHADQHQTWINELGAAQANSEAKLATLTDSQIRADASLVRLREAQANSDAKMVALTDAQIRTGEAVSQHQTWLNELSASQANWDAKMLALTDAQLRTDEALVRLAEAQVQTGQRLDALIDIVGKSRNGNP